jgi:hypothetical protein
MWSEIDETHKRVPDTRYIAKWLEEEKPRDIKPVVLTSL